MGRNCTAANDPFTNRADCDATCAAAYPSTGAPGDLSGDTLQCRISHAKAATSDPALHCVHASPSGGGVCGPVAPSGTCTADQGCAGGACVDAVSSATATGKSCKGYCAAYCEYLEWSCTGANKQFDNTAECQRICALQYPISGSPTDLAGDTVQCRIAHARAADADAALHCPHAGPSGGGACE